MIRINLLPYRAARTKENIRRQISIFILSIVFLIVLLLGGLAYLKSKVNTLADRLESINNELKIYEAKAKEVEEIKKKLATLEKQIEIVNQLKAAREEPPKLMAKLTDLIVAGRMELLRMNVNPGKVTLDGIALDNETVAKFMTRLESATLFFKDVNLNSSKQVSRYGVDMKQFQIVCIRGVKEEPKKESNTEPDKKKAEK